MSSDDLDELDKVLNDMITASQEGKPAGNHYNAYATADPQDLRYLVDKGKRRNNFIGAAIAILIAAAVYFLDMSGLLLTAFPQFKTAPKASRGSLKI